MLRNAILLAGVSLTACDVQSAKQVSNGFDQTVGTEQAAATPSTEAPAELAEGWVAAPEKSQVYVQGFAGSQPYVITRCWDVDVGVDCVEIVHIQDGFVVSRRQAASISEYERKSKDWRTTIQHRCFVNPGKDPSESIETSDGKTAFARNFANYAPLWPQDKVNNVVWSNGGSEHTYVNCANLDKILGSGNTEMIKSDKVTYSDLTS